MIHTLVFHAHTTILKKKNYPCDRFKNLICVCMSYPTCSLFGEVGITTGMVELSVIYISYFSIDMAYQFTIGYSIHEYSSEIIFIVTGLRGHKQATIN